MSRKIKLPRRNFLALTAAAAAEPFAGCQRKRGTSLLRAKALALPQTRGDELAGTPPALPGGTL